MSGLFVRTDPFEGGASATDFKCGTMGDSCEIQARSLNQLTYMSRVLVMSLQLPCITFSLGLKKETTHEHEQTM
eukprot:3687481-Amphidinium_carterae.1